MGARLVLVGVDALAWVGWCALVGWVASRWPAARLGRDGWVTRPRRWEEEGGLYARLRVRRWARIIPDAGGLFPGGRPKRVLGGGRAGLESLLAELRRAEGAHWWMLALSPAFFLWNPWWLALAMFGYGMVANLAPIVVVRAARTRVRGVLARRGPGSGRG